MKREAYDVCVIGGGPAGAIIAARLGEYGFSVVLLEGVTRAAPSCAYSIPAAAANWLREVGGGADFTRTGTLHLQGSLLRWNRTETETRDSASLIVDPVALAATLRTEAMKKGVALLQPIKVQRLEVTANGWQIHCVTGPPLNARFVVDATGRRSKFAGARIPHLPRTAALVASFSDVPLPATRQCSEALADGWLWGAPMPEGGWAVAMFTDPAQLQGLSEAQRLARLQQWLAASELLRPCLQGRRRTAPRVCDATGERAAVVATPNLLRIGDAALALDPLSSQGVLASVRSAWQGASGVRTILARPEQTAAAIAFHEAGIRRGAAQNRAVAGKLYAEVNRFAKLPFWSARALPAAPPPPRAKDFSEATRLRLSPQATLQLAPVLRDGWIEEATALHAPMLAEPVAYLGDIALAPLLRGIEPGCAGAELLRRWVKRFPLSQGRTLLGWLWQTGTLEAL